MMKKLILIVNIIIILMFSGCKPSITPPTTQTATQAPTQDKPTRTASPEPSQTATITSIPSATTTSTPVNTPTTGVTSTPAAISPANLSGLQQVATYILPVRGRLQDARWSQDGIQVLAITDIGTWLLSSAYLKQLHFFRGMDPSTELEDGKWIVWSEGQRKYLHLDSEGYQLLPLDDRLDESGMDLVSRNGETSVRRISEDEVEIISLKTGNRRSFNISEAGYHLKYMRPAAISPNGNVLIIQDTYWSDLYFINLETLEVAYELSNIYDEPTFSPDGQYVLLTDNGGIKVLKATNGIQVNRFSDGFIVRPTRQTYIYYRAVAYDWFPDSQHVGVVYCVENQACELYIWSMATGQPEKIVKGLPIQTSGLDFSPQEDAFLTISADGKLATWSLPDQTQLAESQPFDRAKPAISPDGRLAAIPRGNQIEIFDVQTGELWMEFGDYQDVTVLMVDSITEEYLLVAGVDHGGPFSDLWDLASGEPIRNFRSLDYPNTYSGEPYCTLTAQGNRLACGENPLQIFDVENGALLYSNKSEQGKLVWALSPDGGALASCTVAYAPETYEEIPADIIYLLDYASNPPVVLDIIEVPQGEICSPLVFSPDGRYLAAQSGYIWKLDEPQSQARFTPQDDVLMLFNPAASLLVSGKRLIRVDNGAVLEELAVNGDVEMIGFDTGGYKLVLATVNGIEVWKVK